MNISSLFEQQPSEQWGLRGDPFLWDELRQRTVDAEFPATASELKTLLERLFHEATGIELSSRETSVYVERFAHGGMSSGRVDLVFWRQTALPVLVERFTKMRFTLASRRWYAAEFLGEEFGDAIRSLSPIRIEAVIPSNSGRRRITIAFFHANYPMGVQDKRGSFETIERSKHFWLGRSLDHQPARLLLVYEIAWQWLERHFSVESRLEDDVQMHLQRVYK